MALTELLHDGTAYPPGSRVLEAGCGIGAQTVILAKNSPAAHFTSIDVSRESLGEAVIRAEKSGITNVLFGRADLFRLPFEDDAFDHVFVCFVLEHLSRPLDALSALKRVLKPGGSITVIEGDHESAFFHPESEEARLAVRALIKIQQRLGGNSLIGRRLYPLLKEAGFQSVRVRPRMVYVDSSRPDLVEGFTQNTFIAMVEGVREQALSSNMIDEAAWDRGIRDLRRTMAEDGTFCYTFFKATAANPEGRPD